MKPILLLIRRKFGSSSIVISSWGNFMRVNSISRNKKQTKLRKLETLEDRYLMTGNVYDDALSDGWQNWSWGTNADFAETTTVQSGSSSIEVEYTEAWAGLFLSIPENTATAPDSELEFMIHGGTTGGQSVSVYVVDGAGEWLNAGVIDMAPNIWREVRVPLSAVDSPDRISGLVFQESNGSNQPAYYLDNIGITSPTDTVNNGDNESPNQPSDATIAQVIYDDALQSPWQNWSWGTEVDQVNNSPVQNGNASLAAQHVDGWSGLFLSMPESVVTDGLDELHFSINGGLGGQTINLFVIDGDGTYLPAIKLNPAANRWTDQQVSLAAVGGPDEISGLVFQEFTGSGNQNRFYLDDIFLTIDDGTTPPGDGDPIQTGTGPTITIDPTSINRRISDEIYGLNFADEAFAAEIDLPVDRWGGNATTRYNYLVDASNRGSDWFFENHPDDETQNVSALPIGSGMDRFVDLNERVGAESIVTVGTIGWTAKSREIEGGFAVEKYGPQQAVDPWRPLGNGVRPDGSYITGNDPFDTSIAIDEEFTSDMIEHLVSQHGTAAEGGVQYYALDNEPMLWNSTHRDVHPEPASYDEVLERGIAHAAAIKRVDPTAEILGPTVWGWTAYFYSAFDAAGDGAWWANPQDKNAHGGLDFLPWYLQEMADVEAQTGERLLDYLDIHYYPQDDGVALTRDAGSLVTQSTRLESTRSLWDPTYVDTSWIAEEVQLIPRMRAWIDEYYPETKLAITEYNFGATGHINGAVAQADVLGVFGREGVDLATMWGPPANDAPAAYSFRMFRNYDGAGTEGSQFGEVSVAATSSDQSEVSVYAAQRDADGALTVMLVNKSTSELTTPIQLPTEYDGLDVEVYTYAASNLSSIERSDVSLNLGQNDEFEITLSGYSITLLELPSTSPVVTTPVNVSSVDRSGSPDELGSITLTFDADASSSLDLELKRGNTSIDISSVVPAWNGASQQATWDFSTLDLQPGRYKIAWSGPLDEAYDAEFLVAYRGDANLDGEVNFPDLLGLIEGLGLSDPTWQQGDFNDDSEITFADFLDLSDNFGKSVDALFAG